MATIVEELIGVLGWQMKPGTEEKFAKFEKSLDTVIGGFVKLGAAVVGGISALAAGAVVVNEQTRQSIFLARSVGMAVDQYEAWDDILGDIGMSGGAAIKMMARMGRAIGDAKTGNATQQIKDSFESLHISIKEIEKLDPAGQMEAILDASLKLGDTQVAQSALVALMGREAPIILGHLKNQGKTIKEIIADSMAMIALNEDGVRGAEAFANQWDAIDTFIGSAKKQVFGLIGGALAPMLKQWAEWLKQNKELVQTKLKEWADKLAKAIEWLWDKAMKLARGIDWLVGRMGGFKNIIKLLSFVLASLVATKVILWLGKLNAAFKAAGTSAMIAQAKMFLIPLAILAILLAIEDLYSFTQGKDTITERLLRLIGEGLGVDDVDAMVEHVRGAVTWYRDYLVGLFEGFVGAVQRHAGTLAAIVTFLSDVFQGDISTGWAKFTKNLEDVWGATFKSIKSTASDVKDFIISIMSGLVDWISDKVLSPIKGVAKEVKEIILPLFGIETKKPTRQEFISSSGSYKGSLSPSVNSAAGLPGISSALAAASSAQAGTAAFFPPKPMWRMNQKSETKIDLKMTVNAAPGQDEKKIADHVVKAVKQRMGEEFSRAVRANNTGVER